MSLKVLITNFESNSHSKIVSSLRSSFFFSIYFYPVTIISCCESNKCFGSIVHELMPFRTQPALKLIGYAFGVGYKLQTVAPTPCRVYYE